MWSPYQIEIVLHYHVSNALFPRSGAPAYAQAASCLIDAGILIENPDTATLTTTELGKALVAMWCETPLPVQSFVDPRFAALDKGREP